MEAIMFKWAVRALLLIPVGVACSVEPPTARHQQIQQPVSGGDGGSRGGDGTGRGPRTGRRAAAEAALPSPFRVLMPEGQSSAQTAGFRQNLAKSKFRAGNINYKVEETPTLRRTQGDFGEYVEYINGFVSSTTKPEAPPFNAGPFSYDPVAHTSRVLQYFKQAGLPQDQIEGTSVTTLMGEGGTTNGEHGGNTVLHKQLVGFSTVVNRAIAGVHVAESFAWAMFNRDDDVVFEQVWWPDLPSDMLDQIAAFKAALTKSEFRNALPSHLQAVTGRLTIHHSMPTGDKWQARVTYDIHEKAPERHHYFDLSGAEVDLRWNSRPSAKKP